MIFNDGNAKASIILAQHFLEIEEIKCQFHNFNFNFYSEFLR